MATKLKNLEVNKVDFVDEGANPGAHIRLFKRKDSEGQPEEDSTSKGQGNPLKKLLGFIGKAAGMGQDEIDSAASEIQKSGSYSFNERLDEAKNRKIADEIWDLCYALQSSLCSILNDNELGSTDAEAAMQESLGEFMEVAGEAVSRWSAGNTSNIVKRNPGILAPWELENMKSARDRLSGTIDNAVAKAAEKTGSTGMEGETEMEIDKSKLTPAELAFLDSIEKRYGKAGTGKQGSAGAEAGGQIPDATGAGMPGVAKSQGGSTDTGTLEATGTGHAPSVQEGLQDGSGGIYKGLHPAVAAELAELQKFKQAAEEKELAEVAKKYAIIGKKEEELVPLFKSLKAAGGTAYDDMVAVLDQAVEIVEKSGAFSEIGKSGRGGSENSAEAKISNIAKSYMEKNPSLDYQAAVAKAWEDNPGLLAEYDGQAGF